MAVTLLVGPETSLQNVDDHVREMDAPVHELEPDAAPLNALLERIGTSPARNPKIEWMEDEAMPRLTTLSASAAASATTYSVTADIFRVGDLIRFPTQGFAVLVTATGSGTITVSKVGPESHVSAASGSEVFIVSNAENEGATHPREIKITQLVVPFNYVQIVTDDFGVTGTEDATEHYSGPERARLQKKFGIEHSRKLDQVFWFGTRDISGSRRFCGGVKHFLATNVTADTNGTTETDWQAFLRQAFRYGSSSKVAFCSPLAISVLEGFARSNVRVVNDRASTFGIRMTQYVSGHGEVMLVRVPWWQDSAVYNGYCFVLDMDAIRKRPLRPTRLRQNIQNPGYDGFIDQYLTECSLQVTHERRHALMTGIS